MNLAAKMFFTIIDSAANLCLAAIMCLPVMHILRWRPRLNHVHEYYCLLLAINIKLPGCVIALNLWLVKAWP